MENKTHAFAAGTFVLALIALLVAMAVWLTRDSGERHVYDISTAQAISGLQTQADVRFRGVLVGKVDSISFDLGIKGHVLVRMLLDVNTPVTRSTFAIITAQGVTGLGFVQLDDDAPGAPLLAPNDANPPRIPLRPGVVDQLLKQSAAILGQIEQVSVGLAHLISTDNQASVQTAISQMGAAAGSVNELAKALRPTLATLPALSHQSSQTLVSLQTAAVDISAAATKMGDASTTLVKTVDAFGAATLPKLGEVADETMLTMRQLRLTVSAVGENPQALIFGHGTPVPGPGEAGFNAMNAKGVQP
jgi:phospholipid/cholesterol/gamma-HCH transport system substrate-binding protein